MADDVSLNLDINLQKYKAGLTSALQMGKKYGVQIERAMKPDLEADISGFKKDIDKIEADYKEAVKDIEGNEADVDLDTTKAKNKSRNLKNTNDKTHTGLLNVKTAAVAAGTALATGFAVGTTKAVKVGANFNATLSNLEAISGATSEEMDMLEDKAKELGATTGQYTAGEVAKLQTQFSKKGFSPDQINEVTESTLALAAATGEDLAQSASTAAGVLNSYGYEADQTQRITDTMTASFSNSALTLTKYRNAMTQAGKVTSDAGLEVEETTAAIGELVNNNIKASTAGRGMRNIMLEINKRGSEMADILGGDVQNFDDFIQRLETAANDSEKFEKAQSELGKRNAAVFSTLVSNYEKVEQSAQQYYNSAGTAQEKMETQMENLKGDSLEMVSALESVAIAAYDKVKPALRDTTQALTGFFRRIQDTMTEEDKWNKNIKETQEEATNLRTEFSDLTHRLEYLTKKQKLSKEETELKKEAIAELQSKFPNYFDDLETAAENYDTLKQSISEASKQLEKYTDYLIQQSVVEAYQDRIKELANSIAKGKKATTMLNIANDKMSKGIATTAREQKKQNMRQEQNNAIIDLNKNLNKEQRKELKRLQEQMNEAKKELKSFTGVQANKSEKTEEETEDTEENTKKIKANTEAIKRNVKQRRNILGLGSQMDVGASVDTSQFDIGKDKMAEIKQEAKEANEYVMASPIEQFAMDMGNAYDRGAEKVQDFAQKHKDTMGQVDNVMNKSADLANNIIQMRMQKIENWKNKKLRAAQESYEAEKKRIKREVTNEEKKRNQLAQLEQQHSDKVTNIKEKARQKELEMKKAMKPVKIAQAVSNTALGVTKALATLPPPYSFVVAGLTAAAGAAEVATIQAQEYQTGGPVTGGEQMIKVNEKGTEYVMDAETTAALGPEKLAAVQESPALADTLLDPLGGTQPNRPKFAFAGGGSTENVINKQTQTTVSNTQDTKDNDNISAILSKIDNIEESINNLSLTVEVGGRELYFTLEQAKQNKI